MSCARDPPCAGTVASNGQTPGVEILVIGGTGPTGIPLVRGLVDAGHAVTILQPGPPPSAETPASTCPPSRPTPTTRPRWPPPSAGARGTSSSPCTGGCAASPSSPRALRPLRVGRRRARLPGLDEPVAARSSRAAGAGGRGRRPRRRPGGRREGLPDRAHRGGGVRRPPRRRPLPLPVRLRAAPARAPRVVDRAPHPRRPPAHRRRRRGPHPAPPRLHRERAPRPCCSRC